MGSQVELVMKQGGQVKSRAGGGGLKLPQKGPVPPRFTLVAGGEGR